MSFEKKNKLRTSQDVLDRIRWDQTFNQEDFVIGYVDRFRGMMELPAPQYEPGGDIPFHRIYYFRMTDGTFMWDRETRLDLIFHSGESHSLNSPEMIQIRQDQLKLALKNLAEVEEEQRHLADQRERRLRMRARQAARRDASLRGYSSHPTTRAAEPTEAPTLDVKIQDEKCTELPVFRYDEAEDEWLPSPPPSAATPPFPPSQEKLKVISWNVLFDHHHPEVIHTGLRNDVLLELLREQDADVIALQEVTFPFLCTLLQQGWVRRGYYSSSGMDESLVSPYGQIILSRVPISRLFRLQFMRSSKASLSALLFLRRQPLLFTTLHLTSNHAANDSGPHKRMNQLLQLNHFLSLFGDLHHLIAGDFNSNEDDPLDHLPGFEDLWGSIPQSQANRSEEEQEGFTFNPLRNPLAELNSNTGLPRRLDRILLRDASSPLFRPLDFRFLGTQPIPEYVSAPHPNDPLPQLERLHPSDHYGLCLSLALEEDQEESINSSISSGRPQPTYQTALVLVPSQDLRERLGALRAQTCTGSAIAHINLLYGFWPEENFDDAIKIIAPILATFQPFDVTIRDFGYFTHQNTCTAWAKPESDRIIALQGALQTAFPECDEVSRRAVGGSYTPHMTIGNRILTQQHALSMISQWQKVWQPASFTVSEVYLIAREKGKPFNVRHVLPLGNPALRSLQGTLFHLGCYETSYHVARREGAIKICQTLCEEALSASPGSREGKLHVVGSNRLGTQTAASDVDLLFVGPPALPRTPFFNTLSALSRASRLVQSSRLISDAIVPVLQLEINDVTLDLQYATVPAHQLHDVEKDVPSLLSSLSSDEPTVRALQGLGDLDLIRASVNPSLWYKFQNVLRAVRFWARLRQIDSNAHGYLGGISWAVLVASFFQKNPDLLELSSDDLLEHFFTQNEGRDWKEMVGINNQPLNNSADASHPLKILTPTPPARNSARNVISSTLSVLRAEFSRAAFLLRSARQRSLLPWDDLFVPISPSAPETPETSSFPFSPLLSFPAFLVLELKAANPIELAICEGWLNRHIIGFIMALEKKPLLLRPFTIPVFEDEAAGEEAEGEAEGEGCLLRFFVGVRKDEREKEKISFAAEVKDFLEKFEKWDSKPLHADFKISSQKKA